MLGKQVFFFHLRNSSKTIPNHSNNQSFKISKLRIISLSTQVRLPRMVAHDAILDVVAEDSIGRVYNIEVQRADNLDHVRRVRYYCAMLDMAWLEKGGSYEELPDLYMIYLSEKDLWRG